MPDVASLVLVSNGDDWEGLYVNGKLVVSGHKISRKSINEWTLKTELPLQRRTTKEEFTALQQEQGDEFPILLSDLEVHLIVEL